MKESELAIESNGLYIDKPHTVRLFSGGLYDFANPADVSNVTIDDIAFPLNRLPRFGGHSLVNYSGLDHSLLVAHLCPIGLKRIGLFHDAEEAIMGMDIVKPLKTLPSFTPIVQLGDTIRHALLIKFCKWQDDLPDAVKKADQTAYFLEKAYYNSEGRVSKYSFDLEIHAGVSAFAFLDTINKILFGGNSIETFRRKCDEYGVNQ